MSEANFSTKDKLTVCLAAVEQEFEHSLGILNSWECKFIESLEGALARFGSLTDKQKAKLDAIYAKIK